MGGIAAFAALEFGLEFSVCFFNVPAIAATLRSIPGINKHYRYPCCLSLVGNKLPQFTKLSGKERKFKKDTNHIISKEIVADAKRTHCGIAMEDLEGIRLYSPPSRYA
jgi:hypothetical protein